MELLNDMQYLNLVSLRPLHVESTLRVGTYSPSQYGAQFTMHVDLQYHLMKKNGINICSNIETECVSNLHISI
jgi:hypothetical protein